MSPKITGLFQSQLTQQISKIRLCIDSRYPEPAFTSLQTLVRMLRKADAKHLYDKIAEINRIIAETINRNKRSDRILHLKNSRQIRFRVLTKENPELFSMIMEVLYSKGYLEIEGAVARSKSKKLEVPTE